MLHTHAQIWGTLKRYLAYTAAGFVVLGGIGAMEAGRPPLVAPASASQTLRDSVSQKALLATMATDTPSWTQRLRFDLAATVSVATRELEAHQIVTAAAAPYYPAPDTAQPQDAAASITDTPAVRPAAPAAEPAKAVVTAASAPAPDTAPATPPAVIVPVASIPAPVPQTTPAPVVVADNTAAAQPQASSKEPVEKVADASSRSLLATLDWVYGDTNPQPANDDANATTAAAPATSQPASTDDALSDVPAATDAPASDAPAGDVASAPADPSGADADTSTADNATTDTSTADNSTADNSTADNSTSADSAATNTAVPNPTATQMAAASASADSDQFSAPVGEQKVIQVRRGDTLFGLLTQAGLSEAEAQAAGHSLADVFSPSDLKIGQQITLKFAAAAGADNADANSAKLVGLTLTPSVERDVQLTRSSDGQFIAASVDRPLTERVDRAAGDIDGSLFESARDAGLPVGLIGDLIKALSYDVDFQRDIHQGDSFEVMYERYDNENGDLAKPGRLLYASLMLGGKPMSIYYYEHDGDGEYYTSDGVAVRKSLLKTPIDGARITSAYGMRVNPILGYSMMHQGIDFGAPIGTPIYAAGNGVVEQIGEVNGYGNYIKLRHNSTYETAYAHISRFASGIKRGTKVKQGQVIAYVGETGRATGPHLHFEIMIDGKHVNPSTVKTVASDKLTGSALKAFQAQVASIEKQRRQLAGRAEIADQSGNVQLDCTRRSGCPN